MKQEQQYLLGSHSLQRQPRTPTVGQRIFWGVFWSAGWWLLFGLIWLIAGLAYAWWHLPFFFSLPILFAGYIALLIVAVRQYRRFKRDDSPFPPRNEQKESWEDQAHPSEDSRSTFADPQPFSPDHEQFQVPYPGQE